VLLFGSEEQACLSGSDLKLFLADALSLRCGLSAIEEGLEPFNDQRGKNERK